MSVKCYSKKLKSILFKTPVNREVSLESDSGCKSYTHLQYFKGDVESMKELFCNWP